MDAPEPPQPQQRCARIKNIGSSSSADSIVRVQDVGLAEVSLVAVGSGQVPDPASAAKADVVFRLLDQLARTDGCDINIEEVPGSPQAMSAAGEAAEI